MRSDIVVDASVMVEVLLGTPEGNAVAGRILDSETSLHAPELLDLEVANAMRRYSVFGTLPAEWGRDAIGDLRGFPIDRYPHAFMLDRIWELRFNMTAYDAAYVALAELLGATLLTRDRKLAGSGGHSASIAVV